MVVTPGFVDVHTHFDGQITWDPMLTPSCWHGVTTVVMGNCGVGFAPVQPDKHEWLIGLMEGVEDIPGAALSEGIQWGWETFPEYLEAVDRVPKMLDVGAQIPHGAVAATSWVSAARRTNPRPKRHRGDGRHRPRSDRVGRARRVDVAYIAHMAIDGEPVPGTFAAEDELFGIGRTLGELGNGIFELAPAGAWVKTSPRRTRDGVDAEALGRDRPSGHVRGDPERPRPRVVATHARSWPAKPSAKVRASVPRSPVAR